MSTSSVLPSVEALTAVYGPLRTIQSYTAKANGDITAWLSVDILNELRPAYALGVHGGRRLRESVAIGHSGPVLVISVIEYSDPIDTSVRYAVEHWSLKGRRVADHAVLRVAEAEYERQVRAELAAPTLDFGPERFTGGLATFYGKTDVV